MLEHKGTSPNSAMPSPQKAMSNQHEAPYLKQEAISTEEKGSGQTGKERDAVMLVGGTISQDPGTPAAGEMIVYMQ